MRVCLTCQEMFGTGKVGGFGRTTRAVGRELVRRNVEVSVVLPRTRDDREVEHNGNGATIDGMRVLTYDPKSFRAAVEAYRACDADVYHSQDASMLTYLAMRAMPERAHVVTFRDPMTLRDVAIEFRYARSKLGAIKYHLYTNNFLVNRAVRRADAVNCPAKFLIAKARGKYGLSFDPSFLAAPFQIPETVPVKSSTPTVCFVGRWDPRKRPELFFELAREFPDVHFIAVGGSLDKERDQRLRTTYAGIPNLEMTGFIDQFSSNDLNSVLEKSWVMVNTAAREGLPESFIEAAAARCAILSFSDPDTFASRFGYAALDGDLAKGLRALLENGAWQPRGEAGYEYVKAVYSADKAMDAHIDVYRQALQRHG